MKDTGRILIIGGADGALNLRTEGALSILRLTDVSDASALRDAQPDAVLLPLLPHGTKKLRSLREAGISAPALMMTDTADETEAEAALAAGAEDVLLAPVLRASLLHRLRRLAGISAQPAIDAGLLRTLALLPVGVGVYSLTDRVRPIFINRAAQEMFGFEASDDPFRIPNHGSFVGFDPELLARMCREGHVSRTDNVYSAQRLDGSRFALRCLARNCPQPDGSLLCYSVMMDATEAERARLGLKATRSQLHRVFDFMPGAVATFEMQNGRLKMTYISPGCERITGYTPEEMLRHMQDNTLIDVHPEDLSLFSRLSLKEGETCPPFSCTYRTRCKNGSYRYVALSLSPDTGSGRTCYYGVYLDVNAERENDLKINQLINAIPGGVVIYKIGATSIETLYFSDGIPRISGCTKEEYADWIGSDPVGNAVYEDDRADFIQHIAERAPAGAPISQTYRLRRKGGDLIWVQLSAVCIRVEDGCQIYYAVISTLTEEATIYRSMVEDSTNAVFVAETDNRKLLYANRAWKRLRGLDASFSVTGRYLKDVIPESDVLLDAKELASLSEERYLEFHSKSSRGQHLHIWARRLTWSGRSAYIAYVIDETDAWRSHRQLQDLIDRIPGGVGVYRIRGGIASLTYINDAYYRMLGYNRNQRLNYLGSMTINAVIEEDQPIMRRAVSQLIAGKDSLDVAFRVVNSAGQPVYLRMLGTVVSRNAEELEVYCVFYDFDHYVKSRFELESSRRMLDQALRSAQVMAWRYNPRTRSITDSGSLGAAYGFAREVEDAPEAFLRAGLIHPDSEKVFLEMFELVAQGRNVSRDVRALSTSLKTYGWQRIIYAPIFDAQGGVQEAVGTSIDITEQKEREEKYSEQLRMSRLISGSALGTALYSLSDGGVEEAESADERMLGLLRGGLDSVLRFIGRCLISEGSAPEDIEALRDKRALRAAYEAGRTHFSLRFQPDDVHFWLESRLDLIENPYTNGVDALLSLRDVTDAVQTEEVVHSLVSLDYNAVMLIDMESGRSKAFLSDEKSGWVKLLLDAIDGEKNNGAGFAAFLKACCAPQELERMLKETASENVRRRLETEAAFSCVCTLSAGDAPRRIRLVYAYPEESRSMLLCALQDVTAAYEQEEAQKAELSRALKLAEQASRAKTDFFSRMSHDMRTPMNGILGMAELSMDENDPLELKRNIARIQESGAYLLSLINDTLDFQRIESGRLKLESRIVHTQTVLDGILALIRPAAEKKRIALEIINKNADVSLYTRADPVRITQIFVNLLSNAMKFTPEGGRVSFEFECLRREGAISHDRFRIRDTGVGMSPEFMQTGLFKPFSQERNEVSASYVGSGLGLSIVHSLVEMMGGTIAVESVQGKGTVFTVELDFERVDQSSVSQSVDRDASRLDELKRRLEGRHVLLVEDHPLNAEIAGRLLRRVGCETLWKQNGREGFEAFRDAPPGAFDAILMDIRMPVMNGLEATQAIRALERPDAAQIPIIAMTANAYEEDVRKSLEAGINTHLAKPIDGPRLYEVLAEQLDEKG